MAVETSLENENKTGEAIKIFVSMHKESYVPTDNSVLEPIQVGTALSDNKFYGMLHDDDGDNISKKNRRYCELTAQYYAWKNVKNLNYYGFWHYRRYFCFNKSLKPDKWGNINCNRLDATNEREYMITEADLLDIIPKYDIIIPNDWTCDEGNGIMTISEHWTKHFPGEDLKLLIEIVDDKAPRYKRNLLNVLYRTSAPFCNLFIMKKEFFMEYSEFCFMILEEFEKRSNHSDYNVEQYRLLGHIAERLLAVYIDYVEETVKDIRILRVPTVLIRNTTPLAKVYPIKQDHRRVVSVVLACDDKYLPYTSVLLESIKQNTSEEYLYDLVIMHRDISEIHQKQLSGIFDCSNNVMLRFANVSQNFECYKDVYISRHLTVETYYRFLILDVFIGYNRVLYLDCDMVVDKNIANLYFLDLEEKSIGAVRDFDFAAAAVAPKTKELYEKQILKYLSLDKADNYFQAGVLLFDLDKIRTKYKSADLFSVALSRDWYYHDQDVLNYLFVNDVKYINPMWNVYTLLEANSSREQLINKELAAHYVEEYKTSRNSIGIVHFAGVPKPWNDKKCDLSYYFWKYARNSLFYEELCRELDSDYILPNGRIIFTCANTYEENKGIDFLEIDFANELWAQTYICIDIMYLPNHFNEKFCVSKLYMDISVQASNGKTEYVVKNFIFSKSDNDYYIRDNIGYTMSESGKMILFARNVAQYEGYAWRVVELKTNNMAKAIVKARQSGFTNKVFSLDKVLFSTQSFAFDTDFFEANMGDENNNIQEEMSAEYLQFRINEIEKSVSYKLGRAITALPRLIRRRRNR